MMGCVIITEYRFTGTDILITVDALDRVAFLNGHPFGEFQS